MKIITLLFAGLLWMLPAYAQDEDEDKQPPAPATSSPLAEFGYLAQCTATETSLMHLRLQVAASIQALSANQPQPQLAALIESYKMMAQDDAKRISLLAETIKTAVLPQITQVTPDIAMAKANELIGQSLGQIASVLSNPEHSFNDQVMVEKLLLQQSEGCESFANKVMQKHTL